MLKPFPFDDEWLFFVYKNKKSEDELTSSPLFVGFSSIFIRSIFSDAPSRYALNATNRSSPVMHGVANTGKRWCSVGAGV